MKRASEEGLVGCETCDLVSPITEEECPRCGSALHSRKPASTSRAVAFLIAAAALYFPANMLPMMNTDQFPLHRSDTILSGVAYLWSEDAWSLAIIVFTASILVPVLKIVALATLIITSARHSSWRPRGRTTLYRVLETVGHWSMLDVFVVALLAAVVKLGRFASVDPGPAVIPFAGVVLMTMLASAAFESASHLGRRDRVTDADALPVPTVRRKKRGRPSMVWLIPILAVAAAVSLGVKTCLQSGPTIYITFDSADGIEAGTSEVRYKNVPVGKVTAVDITPDHRIVAEIKLTRGGAVVAVEDSQFWVVRPRIGVGGVSGLSTLISGAYIEADIGKSKTEKDRFVGLEKPPGVTHDQQGTRYRLTANDGGSLAPQSPVYLRRQPVGTITALQLTPDGKSVTIEVFVEAPFDRTVTTNTVFWNASGLDVALDASGLRVNTQSLATVVAGGIAFEDRDADPKAKPAPENTTFALFEDRRHAMAKPDVGGLRIAMRFHEPVRGLGTGVGVNIEFLGIHIGDVLAVHPNYDATTHAFFFDVDGTVFPERMGAAYAGLVAEGAQSGKTGLEMLQGLVGRGLRAQVRSGSLLTGSFYVGLDWFPNAKGGESTPPAREGVWTIPTVRGGTEQIQDQVASILAKVDALPFEAIGGDVQNATRAAATLIGHLDRDVVPSTAAMFAKADAAMAALREGLLSLNENLAAPDSAIQQSTRATLEELERAAFSMRGLADYLQHHPEALLRGRPSGAEPKAK